jgi:hypothetical protein
MIHTGLPYDMDILGNIDNEGAIVDMSNLNYPGIQKEDNVRVSYIYLRNTAFNNVTLDFSQTSYEFKRDFLLFYINGDIFYEIESCTNTWIKILGLYNQQDFPIDTILTQDELYQFIKENITEIAKLNNIIASLPIYLFLRLNIEDPENFNFNDIETDDTTTCNDNITFIIKNQFFNFLYESLNADTPKIYSNLFTETNNLLFETIMQYTPFGILLYGMNQPDWSKFVDGLETICKDI